jgi:hypothetical protein
MDTKFPTFRFKPFTEKLRHLKNVLEGAPGPCFSSEEIKEIEYFAYHLCFSQDFIDHYFINKGIQSKLHEFWKLRQDILNTRDKTADIILWRLNGKSLSQENMEIVGNSIKRANQVKNITEYIVEADYLTIVYTSYNNPYNVRQRYLIFCDRLHPSKTAL